MQKQSEQPKERVGGVLHIVGSVFGILLIAVLLPVLIVNMTLIIKSYTNPDRVPTFAGIAPLIVMSGSMEPTIQVDDLIFTKEIDPDTLKVNDIVAFQPLGGTTVVTHRIVKRNVEDGIVTYTTKGDNNNTADTDPLHNFQVVGLYFGRLAGVGKIALFLQQPVGMVVCVAIPLALFLLYDVLRRFFYNKKKRQEEDSEKDELERLRALAAALEQGEIPEQFVAPPAPPVFVPEPEPEPAFEPEPEPEPEPAQPEPEPAPAAYPPVEGEDLEALVTPAAPARQEEPDDFGDEDEV